MASTVSQRTREIGVRMAMGATRTAIFKMVVRGSAVLLLSGLAIGSIGAWFLGAIARQFLFQLEAHDLRAFFGAAIVIAAACVVATIVPARRAVSVDPTVLLRNE
jgi:ABC-type antimicrobial peptide transport system permease subunit